MEISTVRRLSLGREKAFRVVLDRDILHGDYYHWAKDFDAVTGPSNEALYGPRRSDPKVVEAA